jgi:alpha-L-arabinofuranosidase
MKEIDARTNGRVGTRPELAWIGVESNQFGTDEFLKWCELVGTEPYIALNFGTGSLLFLDFLPRTIQ